MEDEESAIVRELQATLDQGGRVPVHRVRAWMSSSTPAVRSLVFGLLFEGKRGLERPPHPEVESFQRAYLEDCLRGALSGPDVHGPHLAAHAARAWIQQSWRERHSAGARLTALRDWLARIYRQGNATTRDAIITGALEHLFTNREMAAFFANWKADPVLAAAYEEAITLSR